MMIPCSLRKQPEIFCCTLIMRRSRSPGCYQTGPQNRRGTGAPPASVERNDKAGLRAGLCLARPGLRRYGSDFLGGGRGGLAWYPSIKIFSERRSNSARTSRSHACWPTALACSPVVLMASSRSFIAPFPRLFELFFLLHAAPFAVLPLILPWHSPSE